MAVGLNPTIQGIPDLWSDAILSAAKGVPRTWWKALERCQG